MDPRRYQSPEYLNQSRRCTEQKAFLALIVYLNFNRTTLFGSIRVEAGSMAHNYCRKLFFKVCENKSHRAISTARLNILLCLHLQPINVIVYNDPQWKSNLVAGFALRCFQRLSLPDADTQRCAWRHNWYTGGQSITVLSY